MAAPTQEYPPWLTPSAVVSTNAAGEVVTSTTIVYLPLTYLGPSIPLNSLYTYGGSTYPPTIVTGFITTTSSSPTPTTTPTTTAATPTTSNTTSNTTSTASPTTAAPTTSTTTSSTTSSSPTIAPSSSTTSIPTTSSSTSASPTTTSQGPSATEPSSVGSLSRGQLVGVIVASILGLIFLFVFLLAFWLWCKGRRNRRRSGQFSTITPLEDDYFIVGEDGNRTPGEGSPRHSGEEADSFLRRSSSRNGGGHGSPTRPPPGMMEAPTEMGTRRPSVPRVPVPPTGSLSSSGSSSTNTSGYGVLLERPTLGILPPTAEEDHPFTGGYALSDDEMREINRESVLPQEEHDDYTGAYAITKDPELAPPRLIDPDNAFSRPDVPHPQLPPPVQQHRFSAQSNPSIVDAEDAALLTARRVNVSDLPASGFNEDGTPAVTRSGFLGAIGLGGLANIGRLSWFNSGDSLGNSGRHSPNLTPEPQRRSRRYSPTFSAIPMTDEDVEAGRAVMIQRSPLNPDIDSFGRVTRPTMPGLDLSGQRPVSNVSGRSGTSASGATVYHDARSSMPGTPAAPRIATPIDVGPELAMPEHAWLAGAIAGPAPPPYQDDDPFIDHTGAAPRMDLPQPVPSTTDVDDILDMPAPSALTHFQSSQFQSTGSSDRDSATVSSIGLSRNPFPPGLDFMAHAKELTGGTTWTPDGSLSAASGSVSSPLWQMHHVAAAHEEINNEAPTIDILEEEPPEARDTWRTIASGAGGGVTEMGRRTTFGLPMYHHPAEISSEQGSLHSMRSHINPPSIRSTGSAPASVSIRSSPIWPSALAPSTRPYTLDPSAPAQAIGQKLLRPVQSRVNSLSAGASSLTVEGGGTTHTVPGPSTGMPPLSPFGQSRFRYASSFCTVTFSYSKPSQR
ncbi:hypothetical protein NMY22_g12621 [Coprinellus aureogranulatus]|nr:hypothetical protein NMY22_g12621 [Coprinellus aureogranulatus]